MATENFIKATTERIKSPGEKLLESKAVDFDWPSLRVKHSVQKVCEKNYGNTDASMEDFLRISEINVKETEGVGNASVKGMKRKLKQYGLYLGLNDIDFEKFRAIYQISDNYTPPKMYDIWLKHNKDADVPFFTGLSVSVPKGWEICLKEKGAKND